jgi:hypothetical protein
MMSESEMFSIPLNMSRDIEGEMCPAGMIVDEGVLQAGPSPPPIGAVSDLDHEAPIIATKCENRIQRNYQQLAHWRSLVSKFPQDPLNLFWREQCAMLEGLLVQRQRIGQKRVAAINDDMDDQSCKRGCHRS